MWRLHQHDLMVHYLCMILCLGKRFICNFRQDRFRKSYFRSVFESEQPNSFLWNLLIHSTDLSGWLVYWRFCIVNCMQNKLYFTNFASTMFETIFLNSTIYTTEDKINRTQRYNKWGYCLINKWWRKISPDHSSHNYQERIKPELRTKFALFSEDPFTGIASSLVQGI